MATSDNITGLREQIMANAVSLFPKVVARHRLTTSRPLAEAFNIIITATHDFEHEHDDMVAPRYMAALTYKNVRGDQATAAAGHYKPCIEDALRTLFSLLAIVCDDQIEEMPEVKVTTYEFGDVNTSLI